ncbi:hypothetical protein [Solidesulfovibrio sp. C21]|uniref:hypothetical protein n=1 Tax=Solidesulfovibrio sp. C21 TaxID=3398613 RepID=UPI0039FCD416
MDNKEGTSIIPINIESIIAALETLEFKINKQSDSEDVVQARLRLESGKYLNQAKIFIKQQGLKWEIEVSKIIPKKQDGTPVIKKTTRAERMKVASLKHIEKYLFLGWSKLVKISELIKGDDVDGFMADLGFDNTTASSLNYSDFSIAIDAKVVMKLLKKNNINISTDLVLKALRKGVVFEDKLLNQLSSKSRPDLVLKARMHYDLTKPIAIQNKSPLALSSEIEETMEKLITLMGKALKTDTVPKHIPGFMYEDLAHYNSILYEMSLPFK